MQRHLVQSGHAKAVACVMAATVMISPLAASDVDPFIYGAYLGKLRWAQDNCAGRISDAFLRKLEAAKALNGDEFDDGRRAAGKAVTLDAADSGKAAACKEIMKFYGKRGSEIPGAFVAK